MIFGEYELSVRCDHRDHSEWNIGELFHGRSRAHCLRQAKKAGWNLYWYREKAICLGCKKKEQS